jgi:hypothetical protein
VTTADSSEMLTASSPAPGSAPGTCIRLFLERSDSTGHRHISLGLRGGVLGELARAWKEVTAPARLALVSCGLLVRGHVVHIYISVIFGVS